MQQRRPESDERRAGEGRRGARKARGRVRVGTYGAGARFGRAAAGQRQKWRRAPGVALKRKRGGAGKILACEKVEIARAGGGLISRRRPDCLANKRAAPIFQLRAALGVARRPDNNYLSPAPAGQLGCQSKWKNVLPPSWRRLLPFVSPHCSCVSSLRPLKSSKLLENVRQ